jgi:hypothetical protein
MYQLNESMDEDEHKRLHFLVGATTEHVFISMVRLYQAYDLHTFSSRKHEFKTLDGNM